MIWSRGRTAPTIQVQKYETHRVRRAGFCFWGYIMYCTDGPIVASPFDILGSIGVSSEIPDAYERLKKEGIEFLMVTARKYK